MKKLVAIFFILQSSLIIAQPLKGAWHGKIYNANGEAIKYINVLIDGEGNNLVGTLRFYDKTKKQWIANDKGLSEFVNTHRNAILSKIEEVYRNTESNVFLFSYINSKRIAVEWVNQVNNSDSLKNVASKQGTGFLEPFLTRIIHCSNKS